MNQILYSIRQCNVLFVDFQCKWWLYVSVYIFIVGGPVVSVAALSTMPSHIPLPPMVTQDKKKAEEKEKEDKKKAADDDQSQTLEQQESMKISGTNARHMVMQKLMRKSDVRISDEYIR